MHFSFSTAFAKFFSTFWIALIIDFFCLFPGYLKMSFLVSNIYLVLPQDVMSFENHSTYLTVYLKIAHDFLWVLRNYISHLRLLVKQFPMLFLLSQRTKAPVWANDTLAQIQVHLILRNPVKIYHFVKRHLMTRVACCLDGIHEPALKFLYEV